jgi:TetR/AcrR family transcriptional regulator, transcriptional repressor for nem operon
MYNMSAAARLVESTQELLWERGYVGTSPRAIQRRAGAGQGSMYHHFSGKADLALAAIQRSAEQLQADADASLSGFGSVLERIAAYLRREPDVLRGCRLGRLAQDPDVIASPKLREPLARTFDWLQGRLAGVIAQGQQSGEIAPELDPTATAATLVAVLEGGYVLARAEGSVAPFERAVDGALALLRNH